MSSPSSAIHEVFCYLRAKNADEAIAYYKAAFGAKEKFRLVDPSSGKIGHAELIFGGINDDKKKNDSAAGAAESKVPEGTTVMISDEFPEYGIFAPPTDSPSSFAIHLHVDGADAMIESAVKAGGKLIRPATDHFYGERSGTVRDPFGYDWLIGHSIEKVTPEEMQRRYNKMMQGGDA